MPCVGGAAAAAELGRLRRRARTDAADRCRHARQYVRAKRAEPMLLHRLFPSRTLFRIPIMPPSLPCVEVLSLAHTWEPLKCSSPSLLPQLIRLYHTLSTKPHTCSPPVCSLQSRTRAARRTHFVLIIMLQVPLPFLAAPVPCRVSAPDTSRWLAHLPSLARAHVLPSACARVALSRRASAWSAATRSRTAPTSRSKSRRRRWRTRCAAPAVETRKRLVPILATHSFDAQASVLRSGVSFRSVRGWAGRGRLACLAHLLALRGLNSF
eukprot:6214491-Pleurochrysis_carterae.AAC.2